MIPLASNLGFARPSGSAPPPTSTYIASIQNVEITIPINATSATATITSVTTSRTAVFYHGCNVSGGTVFRESFPRVALTNSTTVTAFRDTLSATNTVTVRAQIVEFTASAVSSVQHGTVTIASGATTGTATITAVTTARSAVFLLGNTVSTTTSAAGTALAQVGLTNTTTVTATRGSSSTAVLTVGYCVVEFASGVTNSIQQRSVTQATSATTIVDTITSVNTARTMIVYNGAISASSAYQDVWTYRQELTNATTVTSTRTGTAVTSRTLRYTVVEFAAGVINTLQRGTIAIASATSANATITSVNTSRAVLNMPWFSSTAATLTSHWTTVRLSSATNVQGQRATASTVTTTPSYEVLEFT